MNPMPESTPTPIITAAGTGTTWNFVGDNITCKVSGDQTQGAYAVVEEMSPPQGGPSLHLHRRTDEIFYVLEGEYQVVCGNSTFNAPQGTVFVVTPRFDFMKQFSMFATPALVYPPGRASGG
jgi:mannose-6-phosphate isomerase-like protein (cupin superfamily)